MKTDPIALGDTQDEPIVEIEKVEETPKQDREANSSVVKPVSSDQKEFLQSNLLLHIICSNKCASNVLL